MRVKVKRGYAFSGDALASDRQRIAVASVASVTSFGDTAHSLGRMRRFDKPYPVGVCCRARKAERRSAANTSALVGLPVRQHCGTVTANVSRLTCTRKGAWAVFVGRKWAGASRKRQRPDNRQAHNM